MSLDQVEDAHGVTSGEKLLDDVVAQEAAATNDHVGVPCLSHERKS